MKGVHILELTIASSQTESLRKKAPSFYLEMLRIEYRARQQRMITMKLHFTSFLNIILKNILNSLILFSLIISPELMAAVTSSNQEIILQELVDQYNKEVNTVGDFQKYVRTHSGSDFQTSDNKEIKNLDKTIKLPKLEIKDGNILTNLFGEKIEIEITAANNMQLNYDGKKFNLGDLSNVKKIKVSDIRPFLNHLIVTILNRNKSQQDFLAIIETIAPTKSKSIKEYFNSHSVEKSLELPPIQANDEFITFKDARGKEISIKIISETETEIKAYGKTIQIDSKLSPSEIELKLKKEFLKTNAPEKVTLEKIINLLIGTANAGPYEDISNIFEHNSTFIGFALSAAAALMAPTIMAVLIVFLTWTILISPAISAVLLYKKKKEILEMLNKCANQPSNGNEQNSILSKSQTGSVNAEDALAKFDAFKEMCSEDTNCSISNNLERCRARTAKLYGTIDNTSRGMIKPNDNQRQQRDVGGSSSVSK